MITYMFKKICITNRHLTDDLPGQIGRAIDRGADMIILREKDMAEAEYEELARNVLRLCEKRGTECFLHTFKDVAIRLGCRRIHLTMDDFRALTEHERGAFEKIGVSTHTEEEAAECEKRGAAYVTASPVFATDCKPGKAPAGLDYLHRVSQRVSIPVYALGGIGEDNMEACIHAGASGVCMMSGYMKRREQE